MTKKNSIDEQYRSFVPVASDGTFLCRIDGRFWFVHDLKASDFRASKISMITSIVNKAIKKASKQN